MASTRVKENPSLFLGSLGPARPSKALLLLLTRHTHAAGGEADLPRDGLGPGWECRLRKMVPASGL